MTVGELKKYLETFSEEKEIIFLKRGENPLNNEDGAFLGEIFEIVGLYNGSYVYICEEP